MREADIRGGSTRERQSPWNICIFQVPTHVSDPDGYPLVEEVEDHDDDEVEAGGSDRGGQLGGEQAADGLQGLRVLHEAGEGGVHGQAVHDHCDHAGYDQGHLRRAQEDIGNTPAPQHSWALYTLQLHAHSPKDKMETITLCIF